MQLNPTCSKWKYTLNTLDTTKPQVIKFMQYAKPAFHSQRVNPIKICGSKINYNITIKSNGSIS